MIRSTQFLGQGLIQGQRLFPGYQDEFSFFTPLDALQLQALLLTSLPSLQPYFCLPFMPLALPTQLLTTPGLPSLPQLCHNSTLPFHPLFIPFLIILNPWILFQKCLVWCSHQLFSPIHCANSISIPLLFCTACYCIHIPASHTFCHHLL